MSIKPCENGCDAPICHPSKVICRQCMDKIGETLRRMLAEAESGVRDPWLDFDGFNKPKQNQP